MPEVGCETRIEPHVARRRLVNAPIGILLLVIASDVLGNTLTCTEIDTTSFDFHFACTLHKTNAGDNLFQGLTTEEADGLIETTYPNAARKSDEAGFNELELHAAHGY